MSTDPSSTLGAAGQLYVTLAAARSYAEATGRPTAIEECRRELTELLLDAHLQEPLAPGTAAKARYRSRTIGTDITARIALEGRLLVVVSVSARGFRPVSGAERARRGVDGGTA